MNFKILFLVSTLFFASNGLAADDTNKLNSRFEKIASKEQKTSLLVVGTDVVQSHHREYDELKK